MAPLYSPSKSFFSVQAQEFNNTVVSTELINFYGMTTSEVENFVRIIDNQGIPMLMLRLNAGTEFRSGTSPGISKSRQIIQEANSRGIQVCIDLHTWFSTWDTYFRDEISSRATYRSQYITYVKNVLSAFSGSNVYAFMVLNEPQAHRASTSENQFILDIISAAKRETNRPISIRFMAGYSPSTGYYSSQIDQASDFLCRNTYWDPRYPSTSVYGTSQSTLLNAISTAHSQNKGLWITEFGKTNSNLEEQRRYIKAFVEWSKSNDVDAVFCWVSQPESNADAAYNIFNGYTPYPAFYELTNDNTVPIPTPTPTPTPRPTATPTPKPTPTPTPKPSTTTEEPVTILEDSFESGTFDTWDLTRNTNGGTTVVVPSSSHVETYIARFTSVGLEGYEKTYASAGISPGEDEVYVAGSFKITQNGMQQSDDRIKLFELRASNNIIGAAGTWSDGNNLYWWLETRDGSAYVETITYDIALDVSDWFTLQLGWISDGSNGEGRLWVEGDLIYQVSGLDTNNFGDCSEVQVGLAEAYYCDSTGVEVDSVKISTGYVSEFPIVAPDPTPAPTPTTTPTPPPTPTPTPTPSPSPTPTSSPNPKPTPNPTANPTPTPSSTPEPTPTPMPSETPTPTSNPSISSSTSIFEPSPSQLPSPDPTPSPIISPSPSSTSNPLTTPSTSLTDSKEQLTVLLEDDFGPESENLWSETTASQGETVNISSTVKPKDDSCAIFSTDGQSNGTESAFLSKDIDIQVASAKADFLISNAGSSDLLKDNGDTILLMQFTDQEESLAVVGVRREMGVNMWTLGVGGFFKTVSQFATDQWYTVELRYDAMPGIAQLLVDGEKILQLSIINNSLNPNIKRFDLGIVSVTNTEKVVVYADSVRLSTMNQVFEESTEDISWLLITTMISTLSFFVMYTFFRKPLIYFSYQLKYIIIFVRKIMIYIKGYLLSLFEFVRKPLLYVGNRLKYTITRIKETIF